MTISNELYLAILSMDSYNRRYGARITDGGANDTDELGQAARVGWHSTPPFARPRPSKIPFPE